MNFNCLYKQFFCIALLFLCSCISKQRDEKKENKQPNIVYILADDLGYGDIGAFNKGGKIITPEIDNLAKEGMLFTDAHSPSAVCSPTRYGILTGRYSWRSELKSGVLTGKSKSLLQKDRITVASMLQKVGYHTAFIGKWHLGWDWAQKDSADFGGEGWDFKDFDNLDFTKPITNSPNDMGFDYAYGHSGSLDMAPYVYVENGKVTAEVNNVTEDKGKYTWWRKGPTAADFIHDDVTPNFFRKAIDYVIQRSEEEKPFFMYLALPSPHTPILPTEEWKGKSNLNPYGDFVVMIDNYVGELVKVLKEQGLSENTIVIFTSDNGCSPQADFEILGNLGHHPSGVYRGHKADIYEGGHRVPFIIKWPAKIKPNSVSNTTICQTDLMATCAEIAGIVLAENEAEDSYSMLPLFDDDSRTNYNREATVHHSINGSFSIRKNEYKLIFCPGSGGWSFPRPGKDDMSALPKYQLYDLKADPSEENNLFAEQPEKVRELKALMASYIENGRSTPGPKQNNAPRNLNGKEWHQIETVLTNENSK